MLMIRVEPALTIGRLSPEFVAAYMDDLDIREDFAVLRLTAVDRALNVLEGAKTS
jgi:hypothetical protein